jgi:hypothetical protein
VVECEHVVWHTPRRRSLVGCGWVTSEAKGLVPLTQPSILVGSHQGTVALPGGS